MNLIITHNVEIVLHLKQVYLFKKMTKEIKNKTVTINQFSKKDLISLNIKDQYMQGKISKMMMRSSMYDRNRRYK